VTGGPTLDQVSVAVAGAGAAAGAALAFAVRRPPGFLAAVAAGAGYASGLLATHGWAVPWAVLAAAVAAGLAAAVLGVLGGRLDATGFLVLGLVATAAAAATARVAPGLSAGALGPLPPLELPLGGDRLAVLGPAGAYHAVLIVAALSTAAAALLLARGPGPRWRAVGSDPERAAATGLRPLRAEVGALAVAGGVAGLGGALAAHVAGVAGPGGFSPDAAALPLLAALLSLRTVLVPAVLAAVAAGVLGGAVLPAAGWSGPPDGRALCTGGLALLVVATLPLPRRTRAGGPPAAPAPGEPWPVRAPAGGRRALAVRGLRVGAGGPGGPALLAALDFDVAAGEVLGLVGANGAGKTSVLRALEEAARRGAPEVRLHPAGGRVARLPQEGGGFAACTVTETLELAAGDREEAAAWRRRLGLDPWADRRCADLPAGARRLLDLGRVLLLAPAVVLCDEPLAGLGAERAAAVDCLRAAAAAGVAVILADHDQAAVAGFATRRLRLEGGAAVPLDPRPATP
jgi:ABC-type branched-subunit amino acid transport system ATPase component/ABC-type branched-subunit amino acid transport system permease subunit